MLTRLAAAARRAGAGNARSYTWSALAARHQSRSAGSLSGFNIYEDSRLIFELAGAEPEVARQMLKMALPELRKLWSGPKNMSFTYGYYTRSLLVAAIEIDPALCEEILQAVPPAHLPLLMQPLVEWTFGEEADRRNLRRQFVGDYDPVDIG
jgi:hypothetical protein